MQKKNIDVKISQKVTISLIPHPIPRKPITVHLNEVTESGYDGDDEERQHCVMQEKFDINLVTIAVRLHGSTTLVERKG